jgi:N-acetyl-anhydromuramyl-L-alanine amidase AmpD
VDPVVTGVFEARPALEGRAARVDHLALGDRVDRVVPARVDLPALKVPKVQLDPPALVVVAVGILARPGILTARRNPLPLGGIHMAVRTKSILIAIFAVLFVAGCGGGDKPPPDKLKVQPGSDLDSNLRKETGISKADRRKNEAIGERIRARKRPSPARAIAPDCREDFDGHVWSSRNGVTPTQFVLHYTVSSNRAGWDDVYAIKNYFENTRVGSSHFIMDFEGHCLKMVPGSEKAWTQGNANPYSYSVEIIATGRETATQWRNSPLFQNRTLARLVRSVMDAHDLRLRRTNPVGCVFPEGWTDHDALECGNDHHDVTPNFPYWTFANQLDEVR